MQVDYRLWDIKSKRHHLNYHSNTEQFLQKYKCLLFCPFKKNLPKGCLWVSLRKVETSTMTFIIKPPLSSSVTLA